MFATCSKDGYVLLYILPSFRLVRAIKLSTKQKRKNEKEIKNGKDTEKEKNKKEEINNDEKKNVYVPVWGDMIVYKKL